MRPREAGPERGEDRRALHLLHHDRVVGRVGEGRHHLEPGLPQDADPRHPHLFPAPDGGFPSAQVGEVVIGRTEHGNAEEAVALPGVRGGSLEDSVRQAVSTTSHDQKKVAGSMPPGRARTPAA